MKILIGGRVTFLIGNPEASSAQMMPANDMGSY